jgi:transposase
MESMARPRSYPDEFRERAVRLVREWRAERGLSDGGLTVVAALLGLHRETLRRWVLEQEADGDARPGPSQAERSRIAELERENKELRRANEILKTAAAFFGAELDRRSQK